MAPPSSWSEMVRPKEILLEQPKERLKICDHLTWTGPNLGLALPFGTAVCLQRHLTFVSDVKRHESSSAEMIEMSLSQVKRYVKICYDMLVMGPRRFNSYGSLHRHDKELVQSTWPRHLATPLGHATWPRHLATPPWCRSQSW